MRRLSVSLPDTEDPRVAAVVGAVGVLATEAAFVWGMALATDCRILSRRARSLSESESDSANRRRLLLWLLAGR